MYNTKYGTHVVGTVSIYLSSLGREHWNTVKWLLRYLCGNSCMKLCFGGDEPTLVGYSDPFMVGDIDSRMSTSSYMIKFAGGDMTWQFGLQKYIEFSTLELEFIDVTEACKELVL